MATARKKKPGLYDGLQIIHKCDELFPFAHFKEPRIWTDISKEWDNIIEQYGHLFPKDAPTPNEYFVHTKKGMKKVRRNQ